MFARHAKSCKIRVGHHKLEEIWKCQYFTRLVIGISKIIFSKGCPPPFQIMFCFEGRAAGAAFSDRVFTHTLNEVSSYRTESLLILSKRRVHIGHSLYSHSQRGEYISDRVFTHTLNEVSSYRTASLLTLSMR